MSCYREPETVQEVIEELVKKYEGPNPPQDLLYAIQGFRLANGHLDDEVTEVIFENVEPLFFEDATPYDIATMLKDILRSFEDTLAS